MPFELQVALRYLLAKRRQVFISVISLVSTLGVTVGVMALVIALALMTGLQGELQARILGSSAHVFVYKPAGITDYRAEVEKLSAVPGVIGAAPAVIGKAMITGLSLGIRRRSRASTSSLEPKVTDIGSAMIEGSLDGLTPKTEDDLAGIVLGQGSRDRDRRQSRRHGERADAERLALADGRDAASAPLKVAGLFRLGLYEVDAGSGFVDLERGMLLAGTDRVDHIEVKVANVYDAPRIADQIADGFGQDYVTQDWTDINQQLYSALLLEKIGMGIGIGLIVAVAALNIVASLILLVMEKTRDIAILKTMGASSRSITLIFLLQGTIIGVIGTIIGATAGAAAAYFLDRYRVITIPSDIYQVSYLPFRLLPGDFVDGGDRRRRGVFPGHAVSLAAGGAARSRAGAAIRVARWPSSRSPASTSSTTATGKRLHVLRDLDSLGREGRDGRDHGRVGRGEEHAAPRARRPRRIDGGQVRVGDHEIATMTDEARVAFRNRHIGFVFQFHHLLPEFTAIENAMMPLRIARVSAAEARPKAEALLQRVGLGDRLDHRPGMLSGGEQQRVAVSRALVMQPSLLLADEPTGDLDEATADALHQLLRTMHAEFGLTAIIATHNPRLAAQCDRTLRLEGGKLALKSYEYCPISQISVPNMDHSFYKYIRK